MCGVRKLVPACHDYPASPGNTRWELPYCYPCSGPSSLCGSDSRRVRGYANESPAADRMGYTSSAGQEVLRRRRLREREHVLLKGQIMYESEEKRRVNSFAWLKQNCNTTSTSRKCLTNLLLVWQKQNLFNLKWFTVWITPNHRASKWYASLSFVKSCDYIKHLAPLRTLWHYVEQIYFLAYVRFYSYNMVWKIYHRT